MAATASFAADNVQNANIVPRDDEFEQRFIASPNLVISCGCVPVDPVAQKIAIILDTETGITQLPKGRKNIGEDIHTAALRETHEETGIPFKAMPLLISTRATPTVDMIKEGARPNINDVTTNALNCEPSSVCAYRCRNTLAFKLVFWFAAQGDSSMAPQTDTRETWEQKLFLEWVDARTASSRMTSEADRYVIEKVLTDMRLSGYEI